MRWLESRLCCPALRLIGDFSGAAAAFANIEPERDGSCDHAEGGDGPERRPVVAAEPMKDVVSVTLRDPGDEAEADEASEGPRQKEAVPGILQGSGS